MVFHNPELSFLSDTEGFLDRVQQLMTDYIMRILTGCRTPTDSQMLSALEQLSDTYMANAVQEAQQMGIELTITDNLVALGLNSWELGQIVNGTMGDAGYFPAPECGETWEFPLMIMDCDEFQTLSNLMDEILDPNGLDCSQLSEETLAFLAGPGGYEEYLDAELPPDADEERRRRALCNHLESYRQETMDSLLEEAEREIAANYSCETLSEDEIQALVEQRYQEKLADMNRLEVIDNSNGFCVIGHGEQWDVLRGCYPQVSQIPDMMFNSIVTSIQQQGQGLLDALVEILCDISPIPIPLP